MDSTLDDVLHVFLLVSLGTFCWASRPGTCSPTSRRCCSSGSSGVLFCDRPSLARVCARRSIAYVQNAVIVGAGDTGQLIARKLIQHPEYGINLVGFVDDEPKEPASGLGDFVLLGGPDDLPRSFAAWRASG